MPDRRRQTTVALVLALAWLSLAGRLPAQGLEYVKANYTKYEYRIPMRDGVRLFTAVYVPKDTSKTYPILLNRTPYSVGPYGEDRSKDDLGPSPLFGKAGYIFAYQDVRGRMMSEGQFVNMRPIVEDRGPKEIDESTDAYDTIEWLLNNIEGHNDRVGQWGISYPGFYTAAGMIDAHTKLRASSPQAPVTDWFVGDDFHHNGAFFLPHAFNFFTRFGRPRPGPTTESPEVFRHGTPDGYAFFLDMGPLANADERHLKGDVAFWNEMMQHGTYDDFWKARNLRPHLKDIKPAVLTVGGWFDAENLFGALQTYQSVEESSPGATNTIVMGPWFHGGWAGGDGDSLGHAQFDAKTAEYYREQVEFPFFEHHLKDAPDPGLPEALVFETGRNQWRRHDAWPPEAAETRSLYFQDGGGLGFRAPEAARAGEGFDQYVSDPAHPVPFIETIDVGMTREYMVDDQRFASRRPDVLVYRTDPLETDLTLAGPIVAALWVSTTGTDSDWVVKVIDVFPGDLPDPQPNPTGFRRGGFQQLVRGDVMRGKFRDGYEHPEPFEPGEPTPVTLRLNDVYHTFRAGHRIMVQVQSTWFPLVDRNPQQFLDIYHADADDFRPATQRVYRSPGRASHLEVPVLP